MWYNLFTFLHCIIKFIFTFELKLFISVDFLSYSIKMQMCRSETAFELFLPMHTVWKFRNSSNFKNKNKILIL